MNITVDMRDYEEVLKKADKFETQLEDICSRMNNSNHSALVEIAEPIWQEVSDWMIKYTNLAKEMLNIPVEGGKWWASSIMQCCIVAWRFRAIYERYQEDMWHEYKPTDEERAEWLKRVSEGGER